MLRGSLQTWQSSRAPPRAGRSIHESVETPLIHSMNSESHSLKNSCLPTDESHSLILTMTKIPSKWGVTLGWRHSLGGYALAGETFMCYFSVAPRSFLQLVQSGPSLEETA